MDNLQKADELCHCFFVLTNAMQRSIIKNREGDIYGMRWLTWF